MTTPVEYPLYQQWLGDALIDAFPLNVSNLTPTILGPFPISSFSAVELHVSNGGQPLQVQAYFTSQPNSITPAITNPQFMLVGTQALDVLIPATAQFAWFGFIALLSSPESIGVWAAPANTSQGQFKYLTPAPEVNVFAQTFAASANVYNVLPAVYGGEATFFANVGDNSGQLEFHVATLNKNSVQNGLLYLAPAPTTPAAGPWTLGPVQVTLPGDVPCAVRVINNDAAASHLGSFTLVPKLTGL